MIQKQNLQDTTTFDSRCGWMSERKLNAGEKIGRNGTSGCAEKVKNVLSESLDALIPIGL